MAQTSVTQPLAVGGLGVVDITRKVSSLRAVWLRRFISLPGQHLWTCFFDHHVSLVFPHHDAIMLLSRDTIPVYLIKKLQPFYASLVATWVQLKGKCDAGLWVIPRPSVDPLPIDELTSSRCYSILSQYQHIDHRSLAEFRDLGIPVDWKRVWSNLHLWHFVRSVQDTAWLSHHGILPTADHLLRFNMNVNLLCFCGQPETFLHLFVACPFSPVKFSLGSWCSSVNSILWQSSPIVKFYLGSMLPLISPWCLQHCWVFCDIIFG
jgi:hypothetical protein